MSTSIKSFNDIVSFLESYEGQTVGYVRTYVASRDREEVSLTPFDVVGAEIFQPKDMDPYIVLRDKDDNVMYVNESGFNESSVALAVKSHRSAFLHIFEDDARKSEKQLIGEARHRLAVRRREVQTELDTIDRLDAALLNQFNS